MNPGTIGVAIILMCSILGLILSGWIWLCFCSHSFLVVLTESSVGSYEVSWPDEAFRDWMWKPFYCVGLLLFWMTASSVIFVPLALLNIWLGGVVAVAGVEAKAGRGRNSLTAHRLRDTIAFVPQN